MDDPACADRPDEPVTPLLNAASTGFESQSRRRLFRIARAPKRSVPWIRSQPRSAPIVISKFRKPSVPAPPPSSSPRPRVRACISSACAHRARDFDPAVRDRLIAGAMAPASLVVQAQKFRRWYRDQVSSLFDDVDAILAPATPCTAPLNGQQTFKLGDGELPYGPISDLHTQPISFIGLPVVAVPLPLDRRCRSRCRSLPRHGARMWRCGCSLAGSKRRGRRQTPAGLIGQA